MGNNNRLFFRFSKWMDRSDKLDAWIEHFKRKEIPCVIEFRGSSYALWRIGHEHTTGPEKREAFSGKVIVAYDPGGVLSKMIKERRYKRDPASRPDEVNDEMAGQ